MAKYIFRCKDIGFDCDYEASGKYADEIVPKIVEHLRVIHKIQEMDDDMKDRVAKSINKEHFKLSIKSKIKP